MLTVLKPMSHGKKLQWGRAGEGAEIIVASAIRELSGLLQWGRAGEGAEIRGSVQGNGHLRGFNGAAPVKARKWECSPDESKM